MATRDTRRDLFDEARRRWAHQRTLPYAVHGDGQVCRCAVRLRMETLARGLDRAESWEEHPEADRRTRPVPEGGGSRATTRETTTSSRIGVA